MADCHRGPFPERMRVSQVVETKNTFFPLAVVIVTAMDILNCYISSKQTILMRLNYFMGSGNNTSICTLPEFSGFEVGQTLKQQLFPNNFIRRYLIVGTCVVDLFVKGILVARS